VTVPREQRIFLTIELKDQDFQRTVRL